MTRSGGQMIVDALDRAGVRHVFGIPGVHNLPIYDALYGHPRIASYVTRHEQGAAFMADGYARAAGRPGVALVTTGPGLTNAITPLAGAWADSIPLLVIGTAGELPLLGKHKGYLHEFRDQSGMLAAAAGTRLATRVDDLERATLEALAQMCTGRPRPMALEVPIDVLAGTSDVPAAPEPARLPTPGPDPAAVARTAQMLLEARYPILFAGGGVHRAGAGALLVQLAERVRAPVLTSISGKGAISEDHPWSAGCTWRTSSGPTDGYPELWRKADAGLVVGSRLTSMSTRAWRLPLPSRLAHLDLDRSEIGKSYPVTEPLVGDACAGLAMLLQEFGDRESASQWDPGALQAAREADDAAGAERCREALALVRALRAGLPAEGILACDQAIACYWAVRHFRATASGRFLYPAGSAALGFGLPAGIGAQVARPATPVVVLTGDGGFLFTGADLATAVQYALPLAIVLCNDNAYGMIKAAQERRYAGRVIDTVLRNPDFVALARAFGAHAERISTADELPELLRAAFRRRGPTIIEYQVTLAPPFH